MRFRRQPIGVRERRAYTPGGREGGRIPVVAEHARLRLSWRRKQASQPSARILPFGRTTRNGPGNRPSSRMSDPAGDGPLTSQRAPPDGFVPLPPWETIMDVLHYNQRECPTPAPGGRYHVGAAAMQPITRKRRPTAAHPPDSVEAAIVALCSTPVYKASLPFITVSTESPGGGMLGLTPNRVCDMNVIECTPPATVPISPASWDRSQLVWSDNRAHDCASGPSCVACNLLNAPHTADGQPLPLPMFVLPGMSRDDAETPGFCLLCIRTDAAATLAVHSRIVASSTTQVGSAAVCLPPFQNLVDCCEGYRSTALGVRPTQCVFSPISLAKPPGDDVVVRKTADGTHYVDQSALEWHPEPTCPFLW